MARVYLPASGFTIRWNYVPPVPYVKYGIHLRPVDMNWFQHLEPNQEGEVVVRGLIIIQ